MDERKRYEIASTVASLNRYLRRREISDFRIKGLDGETLYLVGSFDLSYYHDVEIIIAGVSHLNLPWDFWLDLAEPQPFSVAFPAGDTAALCFMDRGARRQGEICFAQDLSFSTEHISYR